MWPSIASSVFAKAKGLLSKRKPARALDSGERRQREGSSTFRI